MKKIIFLLVLILISVGIWWSCKSITINRKPNVLRPASALPLDKINLPPGFKIEVFAEKIENARSLTYSPNDILYVGSRDGDFIRALPDKNQDHWADTSFVVIDGLNMPNGVVYHEGDLYIAEVNRILRIKDIDNQYDKKPQPEVVYDQLPTERSHGWKYIAFGPDGKLYIPIGAPCNICKSEEAHFASISRIDKDGTNFEIYAHGVRNSVGFTWHPETKELWFTENGRDWMGDDMPACELNHAPKKDMHFGYPYCHQGDTPDPKFGAGKSCEDYTPPAMKLGPHVAPLGMEFYQGNQFPSVYKNQAFIAEHGSWNRQKRIGYQISLVRIENNNKATSYETFADGWLEDGVPWGRPVDLEHLPDGSMLVSDDFAGAIYRIYYEAN